MTSNADFKRRVRERMARTGESYAAARRTAPNAARHQRRQHGRSLERRHRALAWRDALHEGRVRDGARARRVPRRRSRSSRRATSARRARGDYVLWFEADLYDQLQIAEILARLRGGRRRRASPCARSASTSGSRTSAGSASSSPSSCAGCRRSPLTGTRCELGRAAWEALTAPDPRGLLEIVASRAALHGARRSSGSRRSIRRVATGSRCPSGGCWPARRGRASSCSSGPGARRRGRSWATRSRSTALDRLAPLLRARGRRAAAQRRRASACWRGDGRVRASTAGSAACTSRPSVRVALGRRARAARLRSRACLTSRSTTPGPGPCSRSLRATLARRDLRLRADGLRARARRQRAALHRLLAAQALPRARGLRRDARRQHHRHQRQDLRRGARRPGGRRPSSRRRWRSGTSRTRSGSGWGGRTPSRTRPSTSSRSSS